MNDFKRMLDIAYNTAPMLSFHEFALNTPADVICEACPTIEYIAENNGQDFSDTAGLLEIANVYDITLIVMGYSLIDAKIMVEVFAASYDVLINAMDDNSIWHLDDLIKIREQGGGISQGTMPYKYLSPIESLKYAKWSVGGQI